MSYELIGRQTEQIAELQKQLGTALSVIRYLKDGSLPMERVEVAEDGSVRILPPAEAT